MRIIDCHMHLAETEGPMLESAKIIGNTPTLAGLKDEMRENNIVGAAVISTTEEDLRHEFSYLSKITKEDPKIRGIAGVPPKIKKEDLLFLEKKIKEGSIHGVKIYPSYYPYYPADKTYSKAYGLCMRYDIPVIVHTGAVMEGAGEKIYQKYAHPMHIDDLAVDYPNLRILMAHSGYPWIIDAAQIASKNDNVFLDFSGLKEGVVNTTHLLDRHIQWAIEYIDSEDKILYGSDWPILQMKKYIQWLKKVVPKKMHKKFFYQNSKEFFKF